MSVGTGTSTRAEAVAAVEALGRDPVAAAGNVDVGCFQISLRHHPFAFPGLDTAFDPAANADYAARFLLQLRARWGGWEEAVGPYHSTTPEAAVPYRAAVLARWAGSPAGAAPMASAAPVMALGLARSGPRPPLRMGGVVVWTPAGALMPAPRMAGVRLPRVVVPTRRTT